VTNDKQTPRMAPPSNPIISFQHVSKSYRSDSQVVHALDDVSVDIPVGLFGALVGRSGCGKSTLLNLAGAMDFPSSGQVIFDSTVTSSLNDDGLARLRREKVGFVFQSFQLLHTLTVLENVELPLLLAGRTNARAAARERLELVDLAHLGERRPHQLSGGEMQRTAIARALIQDPRLLLADEPTGNLDTATGSIILALLRRIATEQKTTILMATHSLEAAASVDIVFHMKDGHIEEAGRN
jgi:putative ABC transport system ATP-binding protein